jgi:hypothetical protein
VNKGQQSAIFTRFSVCSAHAASLHIADDETQMGNAFRKRAGDSKSAVARDCCRSASVGSARGSTGHNRIGCSLLTRRSKPEERVGHIDLSGNNAG